MRKHTIECNPESRNKFWYRSVSLGVILFLSFVVCSINNLCSFSSSIVWETSRNSKYCFNSSPLTNVRSRIVSYHNWPNHLPFNAKNKLISLVRKIIVCLTSFRIRKRKAWSLAPPPWRRMSWPMRPSRTPNCFTSVIPFLVEAYQLRSRTKSRHTMNLQHCSKWSSMVVLSM